MKIIRNKTKIPSAATKELIGWFIHNLNSHRVMIMETYEGSTGLEVQYMVLAIAATTNKVNGNSRVILDPEHLARELPTKPLLIDHVHNNTARKGSIIDSVVIDHPNKISKYVAFMGMMNLSDLSDNALSEYTGTNFSIGYVPNSDKVCKKCGNISDLWIDISSKELICPKCKNNMIDKKCEIIYSKFNRCGIFNDAVNEIQLTFSSEVVRHANNRGKGKIVKGIPTYYQAIHSAEVKEVSLVLHAADSERAPLIASISIANLINFYKTNPNIDNSDHSTVENFVGINFHNDIESNDSLSIDECQDHLTEENINLTEKNNMSDTTNSSVVERIKAYNEKFPNLIDSTMKEMVLDETSDSLSDGVIQILERTFESNLMNSLENTFSLNDSLKEENEELKKSLKLSELVDSTNDSTKVDPVVVPVAPVVVTTQTLDSTAQVTAPIIQVAPVATIVATTSPTTDSTTTPPLSNTVKVSKVVRKKNK